MPKWTERDDAVKNWFSYIVCGTPVLTDTSVRTLLNYAAEKNYLDSEQLAEMGKANWRTLLGGYPASGTDQEKKVYKIAYTFCGRISAAKENDFRGFMFNLYLLQHFQSMISQHNKEKEQMFEAYETLDNLHGNLFKAYQKLESQNHTSPSCAPLPERFKLLQENYQVVTGELKKAESANAGLKRKCDEAERELEELKLANANLKRQRDEAEHHGGNLKQELDESKRNHHLLCESYDDLESSNLEAMAQIKKNDKAVNALKKLKRALDELD